jgi:uncharacterized protein YceK
VKRSIALVVVAGILLSGCGTTTTKALTDKWMTKASQDESFHALHTDISKAVKYLRAPSSTQADLHTLCSVLNIEIHAANDHLPTPDTQATELLAKVVIGSPCDVDSENRIVRAMMVSKTSSGNCVAMSSRTSRE